jgi:hypothetical protein
LTRLIPLLEMISKGYRTVDMSKRLGISKGLTSYYHRKMKKLGLVRDNFEGLTESGKNFLAMYYSKSLGRPIARVENVRFKAPILQMPSIPVDWNKVDMNNWAQFTSSVDEINVKLNDANQPTIEFIVPAYDDYENNPIKLYCALLVKCQDVARRLEELLKMKIGSLELSSKGEWVVFDPVAKSISENLGRINIEGVAKINASKPLKRGEFEFLNPLAAAEYLSMPWHVRVLEFKMDQLLRQNKYHENN